jgi:uncharacterized protein involved in exopolysaccharide biosynthesis
MDASLEATNNQILEIEQQIEIESRRMAQQSQAKHDETQRKIDEERGDSRAIREETGRYHDGEKEYRSRSR